MGNGYKLSSSDGIHSLKFGGRIMTDYAIWDNDSVTFSGTEFRRIRFFNSGKVYDNVKYKLQLDFMEVMFRLKMFIWKLLYLICEC